LALGIKGGHMELKDFISATLTEIQQGVQAAINKTLSSKTNGAINPCWGTTTDIGSGHIQNVQFDVAVTVVEKTEGSAEAGIRVVGFKLGGGGSGSTETSNVSRIQFSIPIVPPVTTIGA